MVTKTHLVLLTITTCKWGYFGGKNIGLVSTLEALVLVVTKSVFAPTKRQVSVN